MQQDHRRHLRATTRPCRRLLVVSVLGALLGLVGGLSVWGVAALGADSGSAGHSMSTPTVTPAPTSSLAVGLASVTFDDGASTQYVYARPVLARTRVPATFYLISSALGWGDIAISPDQARQLTAEGHEIGNHTRSHPDLATLTANEVEAEFAQSQATIETLVGVRPTTCAYPHGSNNATVRAAAATHFRACRTTKGGLNARKRLAPYSLTTYNVTRTTTAAEVRAAAEVARAQGSWVIFTYHSVDPQATSIDDVTPDDFAAHMDALVASGVRIETVAAALSALG